MIVNLWALLVDYFTFRQLVADSASSSTASEAIRKANSLLPTERPPYQGPIMDTWTQHILHELFGIAPPPLDQRVLFLYVQFLVKNSKRLKPNVPRSVLWSCVLKPLHVSYAHIDLSAADVLCFIYYSLALKADKCGAHMCSCLIKLVITLCILSNQYSTCYYQSDFPQEWYLIVCVYLAKHF